jgi:nitrogen fixation protein FixH
MRQPRTLALLLFFVLMLAACRQTEAVPAADLQLTLTAEPTGWGVGSATLLITARDATGDPVDDAAVTVRGDMSHAGMQPVLSEATPLGDGRYRADFEWTMAGDWIVTVDATLPDGRRTTQTFDFAVTP